MIYCAPPLFFHLLVFCRDFTSLLLQKYNGFYTSTDIILLWLYMALYTYTYNPMGTIPWY